MVEENGGGEKADSGEKGKVVAVRVSLGLGVSLGEVPVLVLVRWARWRLPFYSKYSSISFSIVEYY